MKKTIKIISIVLAAAVVIGVAAVAINRLTPSKAEETTTVKQTTTVPQTEEITVDWNGEEFKAVKVPDLYENKKLIFEEYLPLS